MQNDSQLAEVLADNIAEVLEKHTIRMVPTSNKLAAAQVAGAVGGIFVPGLGLATGLAAGGVGRIWLDWNSSRVAGSVCF